MSDKDAVRRREFLGGTLLDRPVVVDGNLATSRGWPFMRTYLELLGRSSPRGA